VDTYKSVEHEGVPHDQERFRETRHTALPDAASGRLARDLEYLLESWTSHRPAVSRQASAA
jgi:hypothetical protein